MASRAVPPHLDGASPRDRERGSRYGDDRSPRKGAGAGRDRSRSPRRDRYDDRDTTVIVLTDTTGLVMTTDRKRTSHTVETENENENENENPDARDSRESNGNGNGNGRNPRDSRDGDGAAGYRREYEREAPRGPAEPPRGPRAAPSAPASGPGPRGYGGYGGYERGGREREYDRPLDRRAIEEGRRRREEERARGVVYTDDGKVVPAEETLDVSASASPFPEGADGEDEEGGMDPAMAAMMGFGGFTTTKGKSVGPNADGGANVHKQRTWRQYMNRRGGFNRPLEKMK
ncbi:hypothetical protein EHS25_007579 [Saitozyma podzolica]|uniref:U4/U6.U5 small nuclear ribonucleoprotein 27kDa protein domain-containing protein n=1 Tax=Saitozyma podzolica TaxID=1890683 RepID=A0A427YQ77_9TREE|nr:hypothetical protein EHS25_007579 [Saitozyma podzolica]